MEGLNFLRLSELVSTKEGAIKFLQGAHILPIVRKCEQGHDMILTLGDREDRWRCRRDGCDQQVQLKSGTWL